MYYILTIILCILIIVLLKIGLNIKFKDIKKIKEIGYDKELLESANKFPENIDICRNILAKLCNEKVKIEENNESKASLYIAATDKIIIANIKDTFTRIQTIAHECLHSIQNRKILIFNFIFSNIYLIYFIASIFLVLFNIGGNPYIFIQIYIFLSIIYMCVRNYLENDAMSKAQYLAKGYMMEYSIEKNNISKEEVNKIYNGFEQINQIGIPLTNFYLIFLCLIKIIILSILALI